MACDFDYFYDCEIGYFFAEIDYLPCSCYDYDCAIEVLLTYFSNELFFELKDFYFCIFN